MWAASKVRLSLRRISGGNSMEITLEKIELVKDRTGVSYKEAKEALEKSEGSVVDAIIAIEESIDEKTSRSFGKKGQEILARIKEIVKKGNVSKIVVKKDGETMLNVPVNVGIVSTLIAPFAIIVATAATFGFKCTIEVIKDDGSVIDVSEMANDKFDDVVEKSAVVIEGVKNKSADLYEAARAKAVENNLNETFANVKDKAKDLTEKAVDRGSDIYESVKTKAAEAGIEETIENVRDKARDMAEAARTRIDAARESKDDFAINIAEDIEKAADAVEEEMAEELDSTVKIVDITDKTE